jgi:hypothetical protein
LTVGLGKIEFAKSFNDQSIMGNLNYLERGRRSYISYIVHQSARFTVNPNEQHAQAI